MAPTFRKAVAPTYLFLCLTLGGSAQGIWANAILQILAVAIIAWSIIDPKGSKPPIAVRSLALLVFVALLLVLIQLLPLPPGVWASLPGRGMVTEGRTLLGLPQGWSSVSLAPYDTMATLLVLLPPVAMFLAILHSDDRNEAPLAMSLIAATFAGVLLGLPQAMGGNVSGSPWYFYERSNFGYATGFFANKNHMASLLLVTLPFLVALGSFVARSTKDPRKRYSIVVLTAGGIGVLAVGLILNRSMAGLGLLFPVAIASALMIERVPQKFRVAVVGLGAAAFLAFLVVLFTPIGERIAPVGSSDSLSSRQQILSTSVDAIRQFGPVGSGLGTFPKVYPLFEDPDTIGRTVVNHAHNDYVELIIEMGMAGAILIALFLLWWAVSVRRMLAAPNASLFAKAGAIGSAAILLHSVVDYPLRTAAISSVFAMCLAMILLSRSSARSSKDLREVRHLVIE